MAFKINSWSFTNKTFQPSKQVDTPWVKIPGEEKKTVAVWSLKVTVLVTLIWKFTQWILLSSIIGNGKVISFEKRNSFSFVLASRKFSAKFYAWLYIFSSFCSWPSTYLFCLDFLFNSVLLRYSLFTIKYRMHPFQILTNVYTCNHHFSRDYTMSPFTQSVLPRLLATVTAFLPLVK